MFGKKAANRTAEFIYLEPDEDIISIRDRLDWVKAERAVLIVPRGNRALTNPVHAKLLARKAADLALEVIVVSRDPLVRRLVKEAGLKAVTSEGKVRRLRPKRPAPAEAPIPAEGKPAPKPTRRPRPAARRELTAVSTEHVPVWALFFILIPFVLMVAAGAAIFVPSAQVELKPVTDTFNETFAFVADPGIRKPDVEAGLIPARKVRMEVTGKGSIPTTAKKDVPDAKATGTVIFINRTAEEVLIPKGTVVGTSTGVNVRFTTVETATLPAAYQSRVEVPIVAIDPGPMGNVDAYLINRVEGILGLKVQVINPAPTTGGTVKQVNFVTKADRERLKGIVLQKLHQQALQTLQEHLPQDEIVIPQSLSVIPTGESYDHFVDEVADELSLELKAVAVALAMNESDLKKLLLHHTSGRIPAGYEMLADNLSFEVVDAQELEEGRYRVTVRAMAPLVAAIDTGRLRGELRGLPVDEALERLKSLPLQEPPRLEVSPDWFGRMPWLPFRISIRLEVEE